MQRKDWDSAIRALIAEKEEKLVDELWLEHYPGGITCLPGLEPPKLERQSRISDMLIPPDGFTLSNKIDSTKIIIQNTNKGHQTTTECIVDVAKA